MNLFVFHPSNQSSMDASASAYQIMSDQALKELTELMEESIQHGSQAWSSSSKG